MIKEFLLAVLAFSVTAIVIIILMTAAGNTLFPSAVSILENRLERLETEKTAPVPEPALPETPASTAPVAAGDESPADLTAAAPPDDVEVEPPIPSPDIEPETEAPPAPETPEEPAPEAAPQSVEQMTDAMERGDILPLGDGRVAYKVQSGDTFSQICSKVIGTGRQQVWQKAAEMMAIDYRTIRPGMVLVFDPTVLALGEEE